MLLNGFVYKDHKLVQTSDFFLSLLHKPSNISNPIELCVTPVSTSQILGLNTLGISLACVYYAPWGISQLHIYPSAIEMLTFLEGSLEIGFGIRPK